MPFADERGSTPPESAGAPKANAHQTQPNRAQTTLAHQVGCRPIISAAGSNRGRHDLRRASTNIARPKVHRVSCVRNLRAALSIRMRASAPDSCHRTSGLSVMAAAVARALLPVVPRGPSNSMLAAASPICSDGFSRGPLTLPSL